MSLAKKLLSVQPAAGGGFTPTDIAGLVGWWDASDETSIVLGTGSYVTAWNDKSGNSRNFTALEQFGNYPLSGSVTQNGLNTITSDNWSSFVYNETDVLDVGGSTAFFVGRSTNAANNQGLISAYNSTDGDWNVTDGWAMTNNSTGNLVEVARNNGKAKISGTGITPMGVYSARLDTALSEVWANGVAGSTSTVSTTWGAADGISVCGRGNSNSNFYGDVCEVVVYEAVLSDTDREEVEAYLAAKWIA